MRTRNFPSFFIGECGQNTPTLTITMDKKSSVIEDFESVFLKILRKGGL